MDIIGWLEENRARFVEISDQVWRFAETRYREHRSAALLSETLKAAGFAVRRNVAGIPTAFVAECGTGGPVVAILGEYDALPGLSQEALPVQQARQAGKNGHGCGHNLLGAGALAAALAVKRALDAGSVSGTLRFYGCPAEEGGAAKAFMVKAGLFEGVDISLTWHPGAYNAGAYANILARSAVYFRFHGRTAHAAGDPYHGRSALDAVELMNVGVNYLREHIVPDARVHYVITHGGGSAPNVVPALAESFYYVRAPEVKQVAEVMERVEAVAQGAAMMTGTDCEIRFHSGTANMLLNETVTDLLHAKMVEVGAPRFDPAEKAFARQIAATFPGGPGGKLDRLLGSAHPEIRERLAKQVLVEEILPIIKNNVVLPGSTDVADVSRVTPTGQIDAACYALGTPGHSWQIAAQAGMSIGHKGMLFAAKVLALAAVEFMGRPDLVQKAREEFVTRTAGNPYVSLIPDGVAAPIDG